MTTTETNPIDQARLEAFVGQAVTDMGAAISGLLRLFRPGYAAHLVSGWLPALDGVVDKLQSGASVADVGCGLGASTIVMAQAFGRSTFFGVDNHEASITAARKAAAEAGVAPRHRFGATAARAV